MDLLLDLLNSRPVVDGGERDALHDPAGGSRWAREHGGDGGAQELAALREVRDALTRVVREGADPAVTLGPFLDDVHRVPQLIGGRLTWRTVAPDHARLAVEAVLAWAAVEEEQPGRLRPCANGTCRLFLLDRSRANRARWCSMAACGNRAKARRHYERTR
ncbi:CGNR zinc finger domain-containing protein [Pseudonocardia sp. ICBG1293]|uniref:CGNR zinc finger domain-containing protein n=1 Tax=Pseudonocardia sp. ICBG1293 TaxID=2844382 RepID=UPI001CCD2363|nr:CGNR zinc finger domain-containing protein [Pseudonocardia sp. ICBG1293]